MFYNVFLLHFFASSVYFLWNKQVFDAAVGDVTITPERIRDAYFTMPYAQSGLSLLMLSENDSKPIQWIFLEPLTKELWFATVGGFLFTGFVVWMIELPNNPEYQGSRLRQFSTTSYFAFSTLTFSHGLQFELKLLYSISIYDGLLVVNI